MSTLAERLAALRKNNEANKDTRRADSEAGSGVSKQDESNVGPIDSDSRDRLREANANAESNANVSAISVTATEIIDKTPSIDSSGTSTEDESVEDTIRKITERAFGSPVTLDNIVDSSASLREIMLANGFKESHSVARWELLTAAFNREKIKVSELSISQIRWRIEGLELLIEASKAMINAGIEAEKEKKKRETALEREARLKYEKEVYEEDKKKGRTRKAGQTDKNGALVGKQKLSEKEKFVKKMVSQGFTEEDAIKLWEE